jgi:hypothetical protein
MVSGRAGHGMDTAAFATLIIPSVHLPSKDNLDVQMPFSVTAGDS